MSTTRTKRKRSHFSTAVPALLIAFGAMHAGCGAALADAPVKLTFQLNYPAAGYNAGYELAVVKGFYKDVGLDITIEPGNGSQITAQLIAAGKADIGFADAAPVMKLISSGAKMKVLATILQGNPNQITALKKTGLKSVADLKGRAVALPNGGSQGAMFPLVLAANNLKEADIKIVNMPPDSMIPSLMQGTVEVILGSVDAFGIQLKSMGVETDNFLFIDSGAPTVSTSIIASETFLAAHPNLAKSFVAASLKGWYAAIVRDGYQCCDVPGVEGTTAFYPLYPLLSYAVKSLFGITHFVALLLVANVASVVAMLLMTKFVKDELGDEIALLSLAFFSFFPSSLFLSAGYTESLFLVFVLLSFILMAREKFTLAATLAGLSLGTRPTGMRTPAGPVMRWTIRLSALRPGFTAAPLRPPLRTSA